MKKNRASHGDYLVFSNAMYYYKFTTKESLNIPFQYVLHKNKTNM